MTPFEAVDDSGVAMSPGEARLYRALVRLDAKVDVALSQHVGSMEALAYRVRELESRPSGHPTQIQDHEARLRDLEARPFVKPTQVQAAATLLLMAVGTLAAILSLQWFGG
jgi:hypothetical protein